MPAGKFNFIIEQGVDLSIPMLIKNDDGTSFNLDNYTARMQIRPALDSSVKIDSLTTENGRILIENVDINGTFYWRIKLLFSNVVTTSYRFLRAVYDLEIISINGIVMRLIEGEITNSKEVTR